jgi:hypothetical protein
MLFAPTAFRLHHTRKGLMTLISVVEFERDDGEVGNGGSGARYVASTDGRRWVLKHQLGGQSHGTLLSNEVIGGLLGQRLGIAVPEVAAMRMAPEQVRSVFGRDVAEPQLFFLSLRVEQAENASPESLAAGSPENTAEVVVLNALLANPDVKAEHVLARKTEDGSFVHLPVDWGHAVFGPVDDFTQPPDPGAQHQPWAELLRHTTSEHVRAAVERVQSLTRGDCCQILEEIPEGWRITANQTEIVANWLIERAGILDRVLQI